MGGGGAAADQAARNRLAAAAPGADMALHVATALIKKTWPVNGSPMLFLVVRSHIRTVWS